MCRGTDGLYFDFGAFVVMGDGREGRGDLEACVSIKEFNLNSKEPGHPTGQDTEMRPKLTILPGIKPLIHSAEDLIFLSNGQTTFGMKFIF